MKTQTTSHQIVKEILSEISQLEINDRIRVFGFVLRLYLRNQRHKTLNACLLVIVLALSIALLLG